MEKCRYKTSKYLFAASDTRLNSILLFSGATGSLVRLGEKHWRELIKQGHKIRHLDEEKYKPLIKSRVLVPINEDECTSILQGNIQANQKNNCFKVVIVPTSQCNFACDYCGQQHTDNYLDKAHADAIIKQIEHRLEKTNFTTLFIAWYGGEPLLGLNVIRYMLPRLFNVCAKIGVDYTSLMATNGVLLTKEIRHELITKLACRRIEFTIDGPADIHNKRRPLKNGGGSYKSIMSNLKALVKESEEKLEDLSIRVNVDDRNLSSTYSLVDELAENGLAGKVRLYFATIHSWGQASGQCFPLSKQDFAKEEIKIMEHATSRGFPQRWLPPRRYGTCLHTSEDDYVVDTNGQVFTCTEVPLVPVYNSNKNDISMQNSGKYYSEGKITDTLIEDSIVRRKSTWYEEIQSGMWPCSNCYLLGVCGGACPKLWREGNSACPIFKLNMADRMRFAVQHGWPLNEINNL